MRVPLVEGQSVDQRPLQQGQYDGSASPEAFGAGVARGLSDVSQVASEIALEERKKKTETSVYENLDLGLRASSAAVTEAKTKQPSEIAKDGFTEEYLGRISKSWDKAVEQGATPHARELLRQHAIKDTTAAAESLGSIKAEGSKKYEDWSRDQLAAAQVTVVKRDPFNATANSDAMANIAAIVRLQYPGVTPAQLTQAQEQAIARAHVQVYESLAPDQKQSYYDAHKAEMEPSSATAAIKDTINEQKAEDQAIAKYPNDPAAQLNWARNEFVGTMRDHVVARLEARQSQDQTIKQSTERFLYNEAWVQFNRTHNVTDLNPTLVEALKHTTDGGRLMDTFYEKTKQYARQAHEPEFNDWNALGSWWLLPYETKLVTDPRLYLAGKVKDGEMQQAFDFYATIVAEKTGFDMAGRPVTDRSHYTSLQSRETMINEIAYKAGLKPLPGSGITMTEDMIERYSRFASAAQAEVDAYQQANPQHTVRDKEIKDILTRLAISGVIETPGKIFGSFWPNKTDALYFEGGSQPGFKPKISDTERTQIIESLGKRVPPVPATDENIDAAFRMLHGIK